MARVRVMRSYRFIDKDPVIDMCRTMLQDLGLYSKKNMAKLAALATLNGATLHNMFFGETRTPRNSTVESLIRSCGYERKLVSVRKLNFEEELEFARAWNKKQAQRLGQVKAKPKKSKRKAVKKAA